MESKCTILQNLITSPRLEFLLEAHNGISAQIAEECGFKGIWASSLTLSSSMGLRDNNEASWTQILEILEFMSDATSIPILLDGDTGYGNFNNFQRLVHKLEQRKIAGVCIEDKIFPKTNSFIDGKSQSLADPEEFAGKIRAGKDAQKDDDFCIIARTEAFIVGLGLGEAIRRAEIYRQAGADGILIHSALTVPSEIIAFKEEWGDRCPVLIVPTKYYSTPTDIFRKAGISVIIWANHLLRSSVHAMQHIGRQLFLEESLQSIEDKITPISVLFRLQGMDDMEVRERLYLPGQPISPSVLILAATRGNDLWDLTEDRPKTMLKIGGKPLLGHILDMFNSLGMNRITAVLGYKKDSVNIPGIEYKTNPDFGDTGELVSLSIGLDGLGAHGADIIVCCGDVIAKKYIPQILMDVPEQLAIVVDTNWMSTPNQHRRTDYVTCSTEFRRGHFDEHVHLGYVGEDIESSNVHGEWTGFLKISSGKLDFVLQVLDSLLEEGSNRDANMPQLLNELIRRGEKIGVAYTTGNWIDVNTIHDLLSAGDF